MPRMDLVQVFTNLINNSLENILAFEVDEPSIKVYLRRKGVAKNGWVELVVEDNGTGLSKEKFREMVNTRNRANGKSLGLYLIAKRIRLHGGSIDVVEFDLPGTRVCISLPQALRGKSVAKRNSSYADLLY